LLRPAEPFAPCDQSLIGSRHDGRNTYPYWQPTLQLRVRSVKNSARLAWPVAAGDNRTVIDPLERWREYGEKPDYAGLLTYGGAPYTQDPAELAGFDVAVVGAPTDDLVSDRPGARFGPRAIRAASCPPGPHLESKVDAFEELKVVDFGDAAVLPADAVRTHAAIEQLVGQVVDAGLLPVVLHGADDARIVDELTRVPREVKRT
jgi:hypothetical protein